jgi:hypothetical protein
MDESIEIEDMVGLCHSFAPRMRSLQQAQGPRSTRFACVNIDAGNGLRNRDNGEIAQPFRYLMRLPLRAITR